MGDWFDRGGHFSLDGGNFGGRTKLGLHGESIFFRIRLEFFFNCQFLVSASDGSIFIRGR